MKYPKPCIFCGQFGDKSREHFYPNWVASHVTQKQPAHHTLTTSTAKGFAPAQVTREVKREGNLVTRKLRVVCRSCNNGWMSKLEETAKPILLRGFSAQPFSFSQSEQDILCRWACLKALVAENSEPELATTPHADRRDFFETQIPPPYFRIALGIHTTTFQTLCVRRAMTISFSNVIQPPLLDGLIKNTQLLTFIFGTLVFQVLAARVTKFNLLQDAAPPGLTVIYPSRGSPLVSSSLKLLTAEDLKVALAALDIFIVRLQASYVENVI